MSGRIRSASSSRSAAKLLTPTCRIFPALQLRQRTERFGHGRRIPDHGLVVREVTDGMRVNRPVDHVQVNVIEPETPKRCLAVRGERGRVAIGRGHLGADEHPVARDASKRPPERRFASPSVVGLGGIEVADPQLECPTDDSVRVGLVAVAPIGPPAEGPTTQAQGRELQVGSPASPVVHGAPLSRDGLANMDRPVRFSGARWPSIDQ